MMTALGLGVGAYAMTRDEDWRGFGHQRLSYCDGGASTADRIRGNYENKIRFFSPPEKIFETFASQKEEDGSLAMSYGDFFRALTPYNYQEIMSAEDLSAYIAKFKARVDTLLHYADADGNGSISFTEFFFFVTVLQMPENIIRKEFEKFPGGKMTP
mmetsp:Transcript_3401/g.5740  ORF Transcript_3401/g.5740 Transcript_3401/m.5740 type:complete len:157 (-) Transcript_3401:808-1278(-)